MNVQQINQTGNEIRMFLIPSAALVLSSLLLWVVSSSFAVYRRELVNRFVESGKSSFEERTWQERLLFVDLSATRVKESWLYWSVIWPFMHPMKFTRRDHGKFYKVLILVFSFPVQVFRNMGARNKDIET